VDALRPSVSDALAAWGERVRANREQVDRYREVGDGLDRYSPVAAQFKVDPHRRDEPALEILLSLVQPGESWLDIGAGGGRYALPLAMVAGEVIALDPSDGMVGVLREGLAEHEIANVEVVKARWPIAEPIRTDVAMIAHVGYDVEEIGPFLDGMEAAAARLCVAVLLHRPPPWVVDMLWPEVHGVARAALPALPEFLTLLSARDRPFEVRLAPAQSFSYESFEQALHFARHQTWVVPDGEKDRRLQALMAERLVERGGRYAFTWDPVPVGIVTWEPPRSLSGVADAA
jgi:SAM-dependent methyltransferase